MNINKTINKLLIAFQKHDIFYKINTFKFYFEPAKKYLTKYQLLVQMEFKEYDEDKEKEVIKKRYIDIKETYSNVELLKFLAKEYSSMMNEIEGEKENEEGNYD